ncbi:integrase core domain-containing protein [Marilutibacter maris]|uniref:Integrase n=1 Tax=Marilutibacter maris TaxID=1605891 RepID=A0A2U9TEN4_9GAMM|nr:integrase core domain-containing protein [Lysobacter maris]AWV08079.1 integrase [Lysobacter maris]
MVAIQQGLMADGFEVSMAKLCRWFGVARRSVYYRPSKAPPKVKPELAEPIRVLIEAEPSFGYRTVAGTAVAALEQAQITRFGTLGRVEEPFLLRSDNGLVFTSRKYTRLVRSYGLKQEFITPHCPQRNGIVERVIRTLKEQCAHRHRFES